MTAAYAQGVEQPGGTEEVFGKLKERELVFDATGVVHAPERQCIGPLASPAFQDIAGEVKTRWRLRDHALKLNIEASKLPRLWPKSASQSLPRTLRAGTSADMAGMALNVRSAGSGRGSSRKFGLQFSNAR